MIVASLKRHPCLPCLLQLMNLLGNGAGAQQQQGGQQRPGGGAPVRVIPPRR
jgi:hypothetical protein